MTTTPTSLASQLVSACVRGDVLACEAAVASGACVNEAAIVTDASDPILPLYAAVRNGRHDVVVWLLSHGADPNGDRVMWAAAADDAADTLRALIGAGGDVNGDSGGDPPLFTAIYGNSDVGVTVLLEQPSLDLSKTDRGRLPEQFARELSWVSPGIADVIAREVMVGRVPSLWLAVVRAVLAVPLLIQ